MRAPPDFPVEMSPLCVNRSPAPGDPLSSRPVHKKFFKKCLTYTGDCGILIKHSMREQTI